MMPHLYFSSHDLHSSNQTVTKFAKHPIICLASHNSTPETWNWDELSMMLWITCRASPSNIIILEPLSLSHKNNCLKCSLRLYCIRISKHIFLQTSESHQPSFKVPYNNINTNSTNLMLDCSIPIHFINAYRRSLPTSNTTY